MGKQNNMQFIIYAAIIFIDKTTNGFALCTYTLIFNAGIPIMACIWVIALWRSIRISFDILFAMLRKNCYVTNALNLVNCRSGNELNFQSILRLFYFCIENKVKNVRLSCINCCLRQLCITIAISFCSLFKSWIISSRWLNAAIRTAYTVEQQKVPTWPVVRDWLPMTVVYFCRSYPRSFTSPVNNRV